RICMRRLRVSCAVLSCAVLIMSPLAAFAQQEFGSTIDAINWSRGLAGQFAELSNPVVSGYSLGRLGTLVCQYDRLNAYVIFSQAIGRINTIPISRFSDPNSPRLPVASFTGLWKMVAGTAVKCDPTLAPLINTQAFEQRRKDEQANANNGVLQSAMDRYQE